MYQRMLVDFADVLENQHGKACELQHAVTQLHEQTFSSPTNLIRKDERKREKITLPVGGRQIAAGSPKSHFYRNDRNKKKLNTSGLQVKKMRGILKEAKKDNSVKSHCMS